MSLLISLYVIGIPIFGLLHYQSLAAPDLDSNGYPTEFKKILGFSEWFFVVLGAIFWPGYVLVLACSKFLDKSKNQ